MCVNYSSRLICSQCCHTRVPGEPCFIFIQNDAFSSGLAADQNLNNSKRRNFGFSLFQYRSSTRQYFTFLQVTLSHSLSIKAPGESCFIFIQNEAFSSSLAADQDLSNSKDEISDVHFSSTDLRLRRILFFAGHSLELIIH